MGSINTSTAQGNSAYVHDEEYKYPERYLGEGRPFRIIMVGAGLSGIGATKLYQDIFPDRDVEFIIYEKNPDITGTWLENRYPGSVDPKPPSAVPISCGSLSITFTARVGNNLFV